MELISDVGMGGFVELGIVLLVAGIIIVTLIGGTLGIIITIVHSNRKKEQREKEREQNEQQR